MFTSNSIHAIRRHRRVGLATLISIVVVTSACGAKDDTGQKDQAGRDHGYSYYHDSRINELPTDAGDYSSDHDSRINELP